MRGLVLLCLVGFILSASWPNGGAVPLEAKPQASKVTETTKILGHWTPMEDLHGPEPVAPGNVIQGEQK